MDDREIINMATDMGFSGAEIMGTEKVEFSFEFRKYCEDNLCGQYGANYSCPPDCGTPEEMRGRVMEYKKALVLQSSWKIEDFSHCERLNSAKKWHNNSMIRLVKLLKSCGHSTLMAGSSGCNLCDDCKKLENAPCRHPELCFSCLSAYCIDVKALAEECSMNYLYKDGILSFFGCIFF